MLHFIPCINRRNSFDLKGHGEEALGFGEGDLLGGSISNYTCSRGGSRGPGIGDLTGPQLLQQGPPPGDAEPGQARRGDLGYQTPGKRRRHFAPTVLTCLGPTEERA